MTYLELVNRLILLLRATNEKISVPLQNLDNLTGVAYEAAQWIAMANLDIQNYRPNWRFMHRQANMVVSQGQREVDIRAALTDLEELIPMTGDDDGRFITSYTSEQPSEIKCYYFPYEVWRGSVFDRGPTGESSAPIRFTVNPNGMLVLDPTPSQAINIKFDYRMKAIALNGPDDISVIPTDRHMAMVHWAIVEYYCLTRDKTNDFRQKASVALNREKTLLFNSHLPEVTYGGQNP